VALFHPLSLRRSASDLPKDQTIASDVAGLTLANSAKHRAATPLSDFFERRLASSAWFTLAPIDA